MLPLTGDEKGLEAFKVGFSADSCLALNVESTEFKTLLHKLICCQKQHVCIPPLFLPAMMGIPD
jgi:hypothetical protein